ncbi:MAG TPA: radical SAM protein [Pyrinomonadaceae bacterium]|nr:radical SAM protein [Pyrinomonadaceae bacterium]
MSRIILADLKGRGGYVNKDTVAGGFGSRFQGHSFTTRFEKNVRRMLQNLPSIHLGYLAAIFADAGHEVIVTRTGRVPDADLAIVLTSLVDYRHEREWASARRRRGTKVGFVGTPATHLPQLFERFGDFVVIGEPEAAATRLAAGEEPTALMTSPAITDLDSLSFPRWDVVRPRGFGYTNRRMLGVTRAVPMLTSRSCPEKCTYCPHRITSNFRARSDENVLAELSQLSSWYQRLHVVIRDPLYTLDRERCLRIAEGIRARGLKLTYECETRMDDLDEELIRAMHASGLRAINFGIESPDPAILKKVARRFIPFEHIRRMIKLCWQLGVTTTAFYVIGFLQDTEESIERLIQFAVDLDSTFANFKILTPYPGTAQFKQFKELINDDDWQHFDGYTLNFRHPALTPRRARLLLGMCYSRFFLRPSNLLNFAGLHRYAHRPWLKKVDDWSWRWQQYFDRPWLAEREVTTT